MQAPAAVILVCDLDYCTQMGVTPEGGQSEITPVIKGLHSKALQRQTVTSSLREAAQQRVLHLYNPSVT